MILFFRHLFFFLIIIFLYDILDAIFHGLLFEHTSPLFFYFDFAVIYQICFSFTLLILSFSNAPELIAWVYFSLVILQAF